MMFFLDKRLTIDFETGSCFARPRDKFSLMGFGIDC